MFVFFSLDASFHILHGVNKLCGELKVTPKPHIWFEAYTKLLINVYLLQLQ